MAWYSDRTKSQICPEYFEQNLKYLAQKKISVNCTVKIIILENCTFSGTESVFPPVGYDKKESGIHGKSFPLY